jgi:hypothetical protein
MPTTRSRLTRSPLPYLSQPARTSYIQICPKSELTSRLSWHTANFPQFWGCPYHTQLTMNALSTAVSTALAPNRAILDRLHPPSVLITKLRKIHLNVIHQSSLQSSKMCLRRSLYTYLPPSAERHAQPTLMSQSPQPLQYYKQPCEFVKVSTQVFMNKHS